MLQRLKAGGYKAFLVGGAVRDLYLGKPPKDYDVGTDARPSRLKKLFRNCRIIGRRFRIAHVFFPSGQIVEVATFRQNSARVVRGESGIILRDNEYGTPQQDALRRDLTINGLFYDIATFSVIDYVGGVEDLQRGVIRMINEPNESFREDPVRMLRALRHASRTGFQVEESTLEAIYANRQDIAFANPSRLLEELFKDLRGGSAHPFFRYLLETHIFDHILPDLADQLRKAGPEHPFWRRMRALDRRMSAGESLSSAVLLSLYLQTLLLPEQGLSAGAQAANPPDVWRVVSQAFQRLSSTFRISRQDTERVSQILITFRKLRQCLARRKLSPALLHKTYLSEALEFFQIDLESQGIPTDIVEEWKTIAASRQPEGEDLDPDPPPIDSAPSRRPPRRSADTKRRRRRGGRRRRRPPASGGSKPPAA